VGLDLALLQRGAGSCNPRPSSKGIRRGPKRPATPVSGMQTGITILRSLTHMNVIFPENPMQLTIGEENGYRSVGSYSVGAADSADGEHSPLGTADVARPVPSGEIASRPTMLAPWYHRLARVDGKSVSKHLIGRSRTQQGPDESGEIRTSTAAINNILSHAGRFFLPARIRSSESGSR